MIRVAVLAPLDRACGVGDFAARLARGLPASCEPILIDLPREPTRAAWRDASRLAAGHDVVHVHFEYGLFHVVKPLRNRLATLLGGVGARTVVSLHGAVPELRPRWPGWRSVRDAARDLAYAPFFACWEGAQYRRARHWIAYARPVYERAARFLPAGRLSLLPHPVPEVTSTWRLSPAAGPCLVTPGFVKPEKGYELLVEALSRLPGWRWVVAGGPQDERDRRYLADLEARIDAAGLTTRVRITGYRRAAEVDAELAAATVAAFPYRTATASGSLAWAVACGTPVVASRLPSFAEVAEAGAGVELLDRADVSAWVERLAALAGDAGRLERLSGASLRYAAHHGYPAVASRHAEIYAGLLDRGAR